ncbi:MAG: DNA polymerase III subunit delta [Paludibacteraceae bacterium]|nr:DNA polymerase III subunit delta [Paludibacteraceae bacterium]
MAQNALTYEQVMLQLKQQQYKPIYILYGEEPYYIDKVTDYIEENVLDEAGKSFDQVVLYGRDLSEAGIGEAVMHARGFAMMGGYKVVIVREAQMIKKWQALEQYIAAPQPQSILVIACKSGSAPKVPASPHVAVMQSTPLRDYQVAGWITRYIDDWNKEQRDKNKDEQVTIDPKVTQILADNLGTNLQQIVLSLEKLVNGRPAGVNTIDAALVERNIGISKDFNCFELQEALITGDAVKANRIVRYFASSKDHPIQKELPILFAFFANLMLYHYLPNPNDERAVAAALKINPFIVKNYARAAKRFSAGKTFRIISYFRDTDARSKGIGTGSATELDLWKELIYKILH